jgi:hypothetical protein
VSGVGDPVCFGMGSKVVFSGNSPIPISFDGNEREYLLELSTTLAT